MMMLVPKMELKFQRKEANMRRIAFDIEDSLHKDIKIKSIQANTTLKEYMICLILEDLQKEKDASNLDE